MSSSEEQSVKEGVFGFGTNYFHALGGTEQVSLTIEQDDSDLGHEEATVEARIIENPPWNTQEDSLQQIACSATSTIFLTTQGRVYQSGIVHGKVWAPPQRVEVAFPRKCVEISAGRHFCIARLEQGIGVVSWGAGHFGQLGLGNHVSSLSKPQIIPALLPQALGTTRVIQVATGAWHALALLDNGICMAWGSNRKLQCGIQSQTKNATPTICVPQPVPFFGQLAKICAGRQHSMAIEQDTGRVYAWGASHFGQCGLYSRKTTSPPRLVEALQRVVVADIAAGDSHSLALTGGGRVFVWGSGMDGQLGLGGIIPISRPKLLADLDFVAIAAGREWKQQQNIQAGEPHFRDFQTKQNDGTKPVPTSCSESPAISHLSAVPKITQIYAAGAYSAAVSSSGHLYTWGYNDGGQLGVPRSCAELPLVEVTSSMMKLSSSGRLLQIRSFESQQNVLLPRRVDALADYRVTSVAVGPCNMWCMGTKRSESDKDVIVGQTLYEEQEERRRKGLFRLRKTLSSSASTSSASGKMTPTIMSIQAICKDTVEEVVIPASVFTHAESTGMDEDGASTSTFETETQQGGIILPVAGEHQSPSKPPQIQETDRLESGESLTITSVESPVSDGKLSPPSSPDKKSEPSSPLSPDRGVAGRAKSLAKFIPRRSKARKNSGRSRTLSEDELEERVNTPQFSAASTSPTSASLGPLGFAGGKPNLFANIESRKKMSRSQSVPSRRPTTPPPAPQDWDASPTEPRRLGSVAWLMRGRRTIKAPSDTREAKDESSAKKGRVRKALNSAFGGK